MNLKDKWLAINSILIAVTTSLLSTILHESAHYFVAKYYNLRPELHHNYVKPLIEPTQMQLMHIALFGPFFSLIIGIIILYISIKLLKPSLIKLFFLWFGMSNLLLFLGYMLIAPFVANGDTGRVFNYFKIPFLTSLIIAIITFIFIRNIFQKLAKEFIYYKNADKFDKIINQKFMFVYPIIFLVVIGFVLNLPFLNWFSFLPIVFMPFTFISTLKSYKKLEITDAVIQINKSSIALIVLTVVVVFMFRSLT